MSTTTTDLHAHGGHDSHGEHHNPAHQHHFATMEQQFDTAKIGMWTFLVTEVLMFGGLFVGFGLSQAKYPQEFVDAHHHLQRWAGSLNTVVLLFSSWTMVMAVHAAQTSQRARMKMFLWITFLCACVFMGVKYYEYSHKIEEGLLPGMFYHSQPTDTIPGSFGYPTFFAFYFMMTGLHGIHILIGMAMILWLLKNAERFDSEWYTPVDLFGLYWHIVDMIWIYLFPLYYLIS